MRFGLMAALVSLCLSTAAAAGIPLAAVVRFNTACARFHEGECSGRLSFDHGQEWSGNPIRATPATFPRAPKTILTPCWSA